VEGDLHRLKQHCDALQLSLGRPITLRDSEFPDVWSAIEFILSEERSSEDLGDIRRTVLDLQAVVTTILTDKNQQTELKSKMTTLENVVPNETNTRDR
jgi:hypothetical protein